jgi:hypothetical protein
LSKLVVPELDTSFSPEEVRSELQSILSSRTFERSERLRRFLTYVCELTLRGEAARINEYLIGSEVFGRGDNYSPNEDSVVRRQAHALRHKLQEYYAKEGQETAIRIELPVGKYVPVFRRTPPAPTRDGKGEDFSTRHWRLAGVAILLSLLTFLTGWAVGRHAAPSLPPAVSEIWKPWLDDPSGAVICFSNPLTTVVKHYDKEVPLEAAPNRFRADASTDEPLRRFFALPPNGFLYLTPTLAQGKMGEAVSAVHLAGLLSRANLPVRATQSRFLSWEDLRSLNLILLGHNEANSWLDPLLDKYPLRLVATDGDTPRHIRNIRPLAGEPSEFRVEYSHGRNEATQEYALVSMIPGVDGRRKLLLINGLNAQATQMAAEYLTQPTTLEDLLSRLRATAPNHRGSWHFQAVLKADVRDKVPTGGSVLVLRVL